MHVHQPRFIPSQTDILQTSGPLLLRQKGEIMTSWAPDSDEEGRTVTSPAGGGPTIQRILVGAQLRRLREASGVTREAAGYHIRSSESKISRMELGRVSFKERDI